MTFTTKRIGLIISVLILFGFSMMNYPKKLHKKVTKHINNTFQITSFDLNEIKVSDSINKDLPISISENLYDIKTANKKIGYAFVDKAQSKINHFDYLVLLNADLKIMNLKVLVYREEHGNEIGSKRWLKQFIGLNKYSRAILDKNIDGISGATISVKSMTFAVDKLLQTIAILDEKELLN
jgi:Na+-translocating ferredoxin:NAD+ oxidoreductase RnfG subunit